jgi:DNA polymerase-4
MMPRTTRIAHVWVDDFFVRVERQATPALAGRPVVIGGTPGCPGRVVAASVEAMACGVHPGVTLAEAAQLCPEAAFRPGRLDKVLEASAIVEEAVRHVAGPVEWCAIDEAVVDLAQLDRPRARRMAEDLRGAIREAGHDAAVGVADTRTGARVAARLARPQGVLEVLPGYDGRFLAGLDLGCFDDIDGAARARLRAARIHSLGALAGLSPPDLLSLLGRDAQTIARRAAGIDARPVAPTHAPRRICRVHRFAAAATAADAVDRLRELIDSAAMALRRFGCVAGTVTIRIEESEGGSVSRVIDAAFATARPELLKAATEGPAMRAFAGREILAIGVSLGRMTRASQQPGLFDGLQPAATARRW